MTLDELRKIEEADERRRKITGSYFSNSTNRMRGETARLLLAKIAESCEKADGVLAENILKWIDEALE